MDYQRQQDGIQDRVINIGRVIKVVKGGRRFSFNALVVAGDGQGQVGWGLGKANEVPEAIRKAANTARKNMQMIPLSESGTIPHEVVTKYGATTIILHPAKEGAGVIAGGPVRAVMELAGIKDVLTKCHGSTNPHNVLKAAFKGIRELSEPSFVMLRRGKEVPEPAPVVSDVTPEPEKSPESEPATQTNTDNEETPA